MSVAFILSQLQEMSSPKAKATQEYFGLKVESLGISVPKLRALAKAIGKDHELAKELWATGVHEAKHVAVFISDPKLLTEEQMEEWLKDLNSWDIVDNCCGTLFDKTPIAYEKAIECTKREPEFEKRAGFAMMATLAVHDKKAEDQKFEQFFPYLLAESADERHYVKKAINWALRQIGKRNEQLCKKVIPLAKRIHQKGDPASRWIASDALRELERYLTEGKIKKPLHGNY